MPRLRSRAAYRRSRAGVEQNIEGNLSDSWPVDRERPGHAIAPIEPELPRAGLVLHKKRQIVEIGRRENGCVVPPL